MSKLPFIQILFALFYCLIFIATTNASANYEREKRWAAEILPGLIVGEPIYLKQKNQHSFLTLFAETEQKQTALVIVHGMGLHPDWGMIGTLRRDLNDFGYSTLSLQMPILNSDASYKEYPALFPEAVERLNISVKFLKQKGYEKIVVISHSNGSRMSRVFMASNPPFVDAWVALSLTQGDTFSGIEIPVLDLYGELDLPHVTASVNQRRSSLSHDESIQQVIHGADHFFNQHEDELIKKIDGFLKRTLK